MKLHDNSCLKLIGLFMFCCLCSKFIIILPYVIRVIPLPNIPLFVCFSVQIVPLSFTTAMAPMAIAIGIDRALSVFFPIWYCKKRKLWYMLTLYALIGIYPLYLALFMLKHTIENPFIQTNCTSGELFEGGNGPGDWSWYFNYTIIACYTIIIAKLAFDGREGRKAYFNRQPLFKSFAIILAIQFFGWLSIMAAYRFIPDFFLHKLTENQIPLVYYGINCLSSLVTTSEFAAIYLTSVEHRAVLKKEFPRIFRHFPGNSMSSVVSIRTTYVNALAAINISANLRRDSSRQYQVK